MALVVNTNVASITSQMYVNQTNKDMADTMARLSSGKRINTAADDAAGVAIASRMTSEVKGLNQAIRNASDAQALIDTAEGASLEIENMLQRMRELAVQAASDTYSVTDRAALQLEVDQLLTEIDRVASNTSWSGKTLLAGVDGAPSSFNFQVGSGSSLTDQFSVAIQSLSSTALGVGDTGLPSGGRTSGHAGISYVDGLLTVVGEPKQGDAFTFTLNGTSISATYSEIDQFSNNAAGAAAQIKAAIDTAVAASPTDFSGLSVVDNGDGSLSITQSTQVKLDSFTEVVATAATATIDEDNGTITFGGTIAAGDTPAFNINGTTVTLTARTATDGYSVDAAGTAAYFAAEIKDTVGLENVIVKDHGDGSLTISQLANPIIEAAEVALTTEPTLSVSYDDAGVISASGSFVAGQQISFELLGKEISFTTSSDDAFEDTLAGVASQMASAINSAGISGVSAAKTAGANSVTLAADVVIEKAVVDNSANDFIVTTIGDSATASVALVGASEEDITDATTGGTSFTFTSGDAYTFEVAGEELKLVLSDTDGYTDTSEGVAEQMKDLINGLGLEGLTATVNATASATAVGIPRVDVTRVLTGTANNGSTVVTNVQSLAQDEIGDPSFSGAISVASAEASLNAVTRIDNAFLTLNTQRASLGAESNRLDHTIDNLSNIEANLQGSRSRIQDADFAAESANLAKQQIMLQAGTAMLAQANASQQNVLSLLG